MIDNVDKLSVQLDPYNVVEYFRGRGQSFARIAFEVPFWWVNDPSCRPLTGRELRAWFKGETDRRRRLAPADSQ